MSFNTYYQDELAYLRDMGREYAERFPKRGGFLAEPGTDPDVERLLEGFAFLTGRVRLGMAAPTHWRPDLQLDLPGRGRALTS